MTAAGGAARDAIHAGQVAPGDARQAGQVQVATGPSFGIGVPNGGDFADPHRVVELARDAEAAGWHGVFLWDHLVRRRPWQPMLDPWVTLTAVACATERIILGPMVTPLARRRTAVVARQSVTLDLLAHGRLRLGVGLGAPDDEFTLFGESAEPVHRAELLDESLDLLGQLWTGRPVHHRGAHLRADDVTFMPRPVSGRIPVWVGGGWPRRAPFRRAARHDGVWPILSAGGSPSVADFADCLAFVADERRRVGRIGHFDACFSGTSTGPGDERVIDQLPELVASGMTWWIESLDDPELPFEHFLERVRLGPPAEGSRPADTTPADTTRADPLPSGQAGESGTSR